MGFRGTVNTVLNFGENGDCHGWLVGPENEGMACMFHMMNEARIFVGLCAAALAYAGFHVSLDYARNRPQGRDIKTKDFAAAPVVIIRHADVRRMLLQQKAYAEGALGLGFYLARLIDEQKTTADAAAVNEASLLLDLLTPITKAWSSDFGLAANALAIQVLGGYGYTREYPVEQFYRDNRLNPIHEGTNGIQAIDLLGRKVTMRDGAALQLLLRKIQETVATSASVPELLDNAEALQATATLVSQTTTALVASQRSGELDTALANASAYLEMTGYLVIAWIWLRQAQAALRAPLDDYRRGKLQACRYFFRWELPKAQALAKRLATIDTTTSEMEDSWF
jgi:butyryl-CoA dehydrogenase